MYRNSWNVHDSFFGLYDEMLSAGSIAEVLDQLSTTVCQAMGSQGTSVFLIREDTQELEATARIDSLPRTIRIPIKPNSLSGYCALSCSAFLVPDAYGDLSTISPHLHFDSSWDESHGFRTRDVMCAPATFKGEVVGVVQVINSLGDPFRTEDLTELCSVARLVGYVLHQVRLYDDLSTMKQLQKEKAKFMRVMIHELKAPVAAAKMMAELVQTESFPMEKRMDLAGRVVTRLDGLMEMIRDTLDLSGVAEGKPLSTVEPIDLGQAVTAVFESYRESAMGKGLDYQLGVPVGTPTVVRMDGRGLNLVISNLVSNAVKYTPAGKVHVTVETAGDTARIVVEDTGMGIPQEEVSRLFTEYFRASNARSSTVEGSGVGLAAVKGMIERFDGQLHVKTAKDEGSTFTAVLPLYDH